MMKHKGILTVDIGNTCSKVSLFSDETPQQWGVIGHDVSSDISLLSEMLARPEVEGVAMCQVGDDPCAIAEMLRRSGLPLLELTPFTPSPMTIDYASTGTLGVDRIAAAVGVMDDDSPRLVVDAGTAVTSDLVAGCHFIGGNISPGLTLRFRSLHNFTSRLPLVDAEGETRDFGVDTASAIRSGVVGGLVAEIAASYHAALSRYDNIQMILTGGDAMFLSAQLERHSIPHRIDTDTVGRGLVRIFNYNNRI
ncbi:MAG: type III pantothenate kinase [Lepagella sp.]